MHELDHLPDAVIPTGLELGDRFRARGAATYRSACRWLHQLPYGWNDHQDDPTIVFADGYGTCITKHAAAVVLAGELGLPVCKHVGFYRLDEDIVAGIGPILAAADLDWLPCTHCFLVHAGHRVDLTAGNCHGKRRLPLDYLVEAEVPAVMDPAASGAFFRWGLAHCRRLEPRLAALDDDAIDGLLARCHAQLTQNCALQRR